MFDLADPSRSSTNPQLLRWLPGFYRAPIGECLVDWKSCWIRSIKVYPGYQASGFGRRILADLLRLARLKGADTLWSMVPMDNLAVNRLFAGAGFKSERIGQSGINRVWIELA